MISESLKKLLDHFGDISVEISIATPGENIIFIKILDLCLNLFLKEFLEGSLELFLGEFPKIICGISEPPSVEISAGIV